MQVAVIPARGGSKRIPRKNIKLFCGKPMIAWPIEVAIASGCFEKVIVSTDDEEISEVAKEYGAETPFMRPSRLADDYTGTVEVIGHAVEWLEKQGEKTDLVCCIYPTAAFIDKDDIQAGLNLIKKNNFDYVFSMTSFAFPIQRAIKINSAGQLGMFFPESFNSRSQDLEGSYHDAGQFYWGNSEVWRKNKSVFSSNSFPILLPRYRVQDIDTPEDWCHAELMYESLKRFEKNQ